MPHSKRPGRPRSSLSPETRERLFELLRFSRQNYSLTLSDIAAVRGPETEDVRREWLRRVASRAKIASVSPKIALSVVDMIEKCVDKKLGIAAADLMSLEDVVFGAMQFVLNHPPTSLTVDPINADGDLLDDFCFIDDHEAMDGTIEGCHFGTNDRDAVGVLCSQLRSELAKAPPALSDSAIGTLSNLLAADFSSHPEFSLLKTKTQWKTAFKRSLRRIATKPASA